MNVVFDFDGVFTNGNFIYSNTGKVFKIFGPHDSDGLKFLKSSGFNISIITADERGFDISSKRVEDMGLNLNLVKESDRLNWIEKNFDFKNLIYMADGIWDINILKKAKFGVCPSNSPEFVKKNCDYVTKATGGNGAVLEASLEILKKFDLESYISICKKTGLS